MKTTKVFKHGNSQAVRLPKEFRVADSEVFIRKTGDTIVLIPRKPDRWSNLKACLGGFKGPLERQQPRHADDRVWPH